MRKVIIFSANIRLPCQPHKSATERADHLPTAPRETKLLSSGLFAAQPSSLWSAQGRVRGIYPQTHQTYALGPI